MTTVGGRARLAVLPGAILAATRNSCARRRLGAGQADDHDGSRSAELQKDVDALVAAGAPGAILLVRDGTARVGYTGGTRQRRHEDAMQPADHYKIASLTKTYTATVVLQLVGEGKLSLDDTVERRLPGLVPNGNKITIRQLLNHTSGLYDLERDPSLPEALSERKLQLLLVAAPPRARWRSRTSPASAPGARPAPRTRTRTTSSLSLIVEGRPEIRSVPS